MKRRERSDKPSSNSSSSSSNSSHGRSEIITIYVFRTEEDRVYCLLVNGGYEELRTFGYKKRYLKFYNQNGDGKLSSFTVGNVLLEIQIFSLASIIHSYFLILCIQAKSPTLCVQERRCTGLKVQHQQMVRSSLVKTSETQVALHIRDIYCLKCHS